MEKLNKNIKQYLWLLLTLLSFTTTYAIDEEDDWDGWGDDATWDEITTSIKEFIQDTDISYHEFGNWGEYKDSGLADFIEFTDSEYGDYLGYLNEGFGVENHVCGGLCGDLHDTELDREWTHYVYDPVGSVQNWLDGVHEEEISDLLNVYGRDDENDDRGLGSIGPLNEEDTYEAIEKLKIQDQNNALDILIAGNPTLLANSQQNKENTHVADDINTAFINGAGDGMGQVSGAAPEIFKDPDDFLGITVPEIEQMVDITQTTNEETCTEDDCDEEQERFDLAKDIFDDTAKPILTGEEIKQVREDYIKKLTDIDDKKEAYVKLRERVKYVNQRSLSSTGKALETKLRGYSLLRSVMCQFSSISRELEYLGIPNPDPSKEFADVLEDLRQEHYPLPVEGDTGYVLPENPTKKDKKKFFKTLSKHANMRTQHALWSKLLEEQFDVKITGVATEMMATKANFDDKIKTYLENGYGVITTIGSHIVSIQGYDENGITIDDPNGALVKEGEATNLISYRNENGDVYKQYGTRNTNSSDSNLGENNLWEWDDVENVELRYIKVLNKK